MPAPPAGEVTITAWVRADGEGGSTEVSDGGMRAISSTAVGDALDLEVYGGFVELLSEDPEPAESLEAAEEPDTGEGPHFFYGLQWWFFGLLAIGGCGYLAWDERQHGPRGERRRTRRTTRAKRRKPDALVADRGCWDSQTGAPSPGHRRRGR